MPDDPVPAEGTALLVYDGECGFCSTSAAWIAARWKPPAVAEMVASQSLDTDGLARLGLSASDVAAAVWWVEGGRRWGGGPAVGRALMAAGGGWGLVGRGLVIAPTRWAGAAVYRVVARYRNRLPGGSPTCKVRGL